MVEGKSSSRLAWKVWNDNDSQRRPVSYSPARSQSTQRQTIGFSFLFRLASLINFGFYIIWVIVVATLFFPVKC